MTEERSGGRGRRGPREPRPLTAEALQEMALAYVARFATSRAKLVSYLQRKLRERGWAGEREPEPQAVADRLAGLGYLDDAAYAGLKAASLLRRGYGKERVRSALMASGIGEEDRAEALDSADDQAMAAALRFAERRRIGPFAAAVPDLPQRQKALAAMVRAGHDMRLARRIVDAAPGDKASFADEEERFITRQ